MDTTVYDLIVQLLGTPTTEWERYVIFVVSGFIVVFVIYMILNLFLGFFRWIWGH